MDEKMTEEKLRRNTQRLTGIAALRKIRTLVDDFEVQDKKNKKRAIVLLVITLFIFLCFIYYIFSYESSIQHIGTSQADNIPDLIRFVFVLT